MEAGSPVRHCHSNSGSKGLSSLGHRGEPEKETAFGYFLEADLRELVDIIRCGRGQGKKNSEMILGDMW